MTETAPEVAVPGVVAPVAGAQPVRHRRPRPVPGTARGPHPALEKLFELHPALFGARFHPLKLGTFEDIMARHPGVFKKEDLKIALGQHARSTRYLECVAMGEPRHDLDGQPVEPVSAEHVFHAVVEVFRRRQGRGRGDLAALKPGHLALRGHAVFFDVARLDVADDLVVEEVQLRERAHHPDVGELGHALHQAQRLFLLNRQVHLNHEIGQFCVQACSAARITSQTFD